MNLRLFLIAGVLLAPGLVGLEGATFFGPTPYLSTNDIPAGLYASGAPAVLENFEHGTLDPTIKASAGRIVPPGSEGNIDSVDADDGTIDGSGLNGHSWFFEDASAGVKFTFPPGTTAAGLVWTDGYDPVTFSAFGPGNVPLGTLGPVGGFADSQYDGTTAEDRFFGVRDDHGVESIVIRATAGGIEVDHVQYGQGASVPSIGMVIDWHNIGPGGISQAPGRVLQAGVAVLGAGTPAGAGGDALESGFWNIVPVDGPEPASLDRNLIQNPGAEAGTGSITANDVLPVPGWTTTSNFTVVVFDAALPAPGPGFGKNYFAGGPTTRADASNPSSSATQWIDVAALTLPIDAAAVGAELSGYLGGFGDQDDRAVLTVTYMDSAGHSLGSLTTADVRAVDRTNHTALIFRKATGTVPAGTRRMQLVLTMINNEGFYYDDGYADNLSLVLHRLPPSTAIFDNTGGSENGGFGASNTRWQAGRFCTGPESYSLDFITLLLSNGSASGQPTTSSVRLQIFSSDPASGKPSVSTGVAMELSGLQNPITLGQALVQWRPTAPLRLAANTCYWAVFSVESGAILGEIASFTKPTGAASTFGGTQSTDAGLTWGAIDTSFNFKMLIQAIPGSTQPITAEMLADGSTSVPGGTGSFISLPGAPGLDGSDFVFHGVGSGGQEGIYQAARGATYPPSVIADRSTPIPGGTGNFLSFGAEAGIIIVGGNVLFTARGSGDQQGIYLRDPSLPGAPMRIVDTATAIPGGTGNFTEFPGAPSLGGSDVVFTGSGSGGQQGLYRVAVLAPPQVGSPDRIVDTATAIPEGDGNFTGFPGSPAFSEGGVTFVGNGSDGQQGLYKVAVLAPPQIGTPLRIADTSTPIPEGDGNFTAFGSDQAHPADPSVNGDQLAFVGSGADGQQGVYTTVAVITPPQVGSPLRVADTSTVIPGGSGHFTGFGAVGISDTDIAFLGQGTGGQTGIYDMTGGQLLKVTAVGDRIGGKVIAGLAFSRGGLSGDPVAFQATFEDGSQGVYVIDVAPPEPVLVIVATSLSGDDLRFSFTAIPGRTYVIESRPELSEGDWIMLPATATSGDGGPQQVSIPIPQAPAQQFYRVRQL